MVQQKACEQDKENIRADMHSCTRWEQMHDGIKGQNVRDGGPNPEVPVPPRSAQQVSVAKNHLQVFK